MIKWIFGYRQKAQTKDHSKLTRFFYKKSILIKLGLYKRVNCPESQDLSEQLRLNLNF